MLAHSNESQTVPDLGLMVDLVLVAIAALAGGMVARWLRQPTMVGYIVAGIIVGPFTPGPIGDIHRVQTLAEIGVAFLMFALGVELSLARLAAVRNVAIYGGILQIVATILLGLPLGLALGLQPRPALVLGSLIALSSTVVALRVLMDRGQLGALHGRIALGILLVQDLAIVPLTVLLPALGAPVERVIPQLAVAVAKAGGVLLVAYWLGKVLVPRLLYAVAATRSRELFLLGVVALALGTALAASAAGLSLAFGAFLAGTVISESDVRHQVLGETTPLRDLFATFFFVSLGMLLDPPFLLQHLAELALLLSATILGKGLLVALIVRAFGYTPGVAAGVAVAIAQIGEFSFVLALLAIEQGLLSNREFALLLGVALLSIIATPPLGRLVGIAAWPLRLAPVLPGIRRATEQREPIPPHTWHTVVCGYGRVGQELVAILRRRGFQCLVIEQNPQRIRALRDHGVPYLFGDAANRVLLEHAKLRYARALAITFPDDAAAETVARVARDLSPRLDVIARVHSAVYARRLRRAGAAEVVRPEFEAALEFARHVLHRYGLSGPEIQALLSDWRARLAERD